MILTGKVLSVGEHHRDDEEAHGVFVEVSKDQLREHGMRILYQDVTVEAKTAIGAAEAEATLRGTGLAAGCPHCTSPISVTDRSGNPWYCCGSTKTFRSAACIDREPLATELRAARERLAKAIADRDTAKARAEQVWKLREEFVALLETDDIQKGVETVKGLLARVKRLENAGDAMAADDLTAAHLVEDWEKAKETTP